MPQSSEQEEGQQAGAGLRWATRQGIQFRRRRMAVARLGGKRSGRLVAWGRRLRKIRLRWVKLKCIAMVKKVKKYCASLMKDMMEAGAYGDSYQHRLLLETSFAIPILGVSFSTHSTHAAASA
ncbi:uncharacterized protein LOC111787905 [Cucurbita pepo subsp. pepo]|uniref:Uncharacterized protein LOC111452314 n=1 Tax=Cucurbita moschata TaxID=3662 RepID=A0A6J1GAR0_CUCMO|nr:uncharacterized protein LOC111452314 [Cucurbita moschata]XP_023523769.1 uncharacterized protein LOC111787905 [Cucurbita pepo subsp. pepo]